ncbi:MULTISPECIES: hypothetical protein [unclassified Mucilaginibacter]|uniref:hypothetical protein n=1 Tax=unclassified Mucilaginibacter TaxID=2617802 RepID=UPI000969A39F|nr:MULTISPECIES: hypothetical protein [unclassified Mucilaginibacter]OJW14811.1 MAG: hypothetical protein BGO48_11555 [Mucilaginibacter sp. 44-25]PLW90182.1 MAG: hypothetical protein C0154_07675 [Mucilaginibacter sp.]HEK19051.1 hypothetical protein [Bacteroidota bacterium]
MIHDNHWNCSARVTEGDKFLIEGLNIWDYQWKDTNERFKAKDAYSENFNKVAIYEIEKGGKRVSFGAVEVSNMAFLIYTNYYQPLSR